MFLFLEYVLKIINDINLEMQSEEARMHIFLECLKFLFRQIARHFLKPSVLDKFQISNINLNENHLPLENIFCGTEVVIYTITNNVDNISQRILNKMPKTFI